MTNSMETAFSAVNTSELSEVQGGVHWIGVAMGAAVGLAVVYVAYKAVDGFMDGQVEGGCRTPVT